jgi:predicted nicotinamide N-methyase
MAAREDAAFVRAHTLVGSAPLVPEVRLHLADQLVPIWEATGAAEPPFWAFAWPGSQVLARWILDHPELVQGQRVLDFAAGSGLAAIVARRAGASSVAACDIDRLASVAQQLNAALNDVTIDSICEDLLEVDIDVDTILVGDVCYERTFAERSLAWLRRHAARGTRILLADPTRTYAPTVGVEVLGIWEVPTSRELESGDVRTTHLLRLTA